MYLNKCTFIGRTTREAESKTLESGNIVTKLGIAVDDPYMNKATNQWEQNTQFINVVVWGKLAERLATMQKGKLILVDGKLTIRKYQDKDGNDKYSTEIVANTVRRLEKKEGGQQGAFPTEAPPVNNAAAPTAKEEAAKADDSLPF